MIPEKVYLILGSNLGQRQNNLHKAKVILSQKFRLIRTSSVYESPSWGKAGQPAYLNQAVLISTFLSPFRLLHFLQRVEKTFHRKNKGQMMPRLLDIDILFFGSMQIKTGNLVIPHPRISERQFVLTPLFEIAPGFVHPLLNKSIRELKESSSDKVPVRIFAHADAV